MENRTPTEVTTVFVLLAAALIVSVAYDSLLWGLVLLFVGIIGYVTISKVVNRS
jgi:hypothetical protein